MNNPLATVASLFRPKPALSHKEVRYVVPTKREATEAQRRRAALEASVRGQLAVYAAVTSPSQRKAEAEAFHEQFMREWRELRGAR